MFCTKCGANNPDAAAYCERCGQKLVPAAPAGGFAPPAPLTPPAPPAGGGYTPPTGGGYAPPVGGYTVTDGNRVEIHDGQGGRVYGWTASPALQSVRKLATSPLYLTMAIAYSVSLLMRLIVSVTGVNAMANLIVSALMPILYEADMEYMVYEIQDMLYSMSGTGVFTAILSMLPTILVAVGMWMVFVSAKNRTAPSMKTSGLTMIKVINIINMVAVDIVYALLLIACIVGMVAAGSYAEEELTIVMAVVLILLIGIAVLVNLYYGKINKTINTMKSVITTGRPSDQVSGFIGVMCYISAVLSIISVISSLVALSIPGLLNNGAMAVSLFCCGNIIFQFRNEMRRLSQPAYPGASGYYRP